MRRMVVAWLGRRVGGRSSEVRYWFRSSHLHIDDDYGSVLFLLKFVLV